MKLCRETYEYTQFYMLCVLSAAWQLLTIAYMEDNDKTE